MRPKTRKETFTVPTAWVEKLENASNHQGIVINEKKRLECGLFPEYKTKDFTYITVTGTKKEIENFAYMLAGMAFGWIEAKKEM